MRVRPNKAKPNPTRRIGLARALSKLGYCSRARAVELIRAGRVTLNRKIQRDPETPVHAERDRIAVDGRRVDAARKIYLMLNKSRGVVTTSDDDKNRPTVYTCIPEGTPWVAPVGRLDKASEGLLLLTNDSEWAARITDPESHVDKTYHVRIRGQVTGEVLNSLTTGVKTSDGDLLRAKSARIVRGGDRNAWLEIILDEGKNRQIRRMMESLGLEVLRLVRIAVGPLALGELQKGSCRPLTKEEKAALDGAMTVAAERTRSRAGLHRGQKISARHTKKRNRERVS
jgi:23S rRNA pseudouridine2605 synthase